MRKAVTGMEEDTFDLYEGCIYRIQTEKNRETGGYGKWYLVEIRSRDTANTILQFYRYNNLLDWTILKSHWIQRMAGKVDKRENKIGALREICVNVIVVFCGEGFPLGLLLW